MWAVYGEMGGSGTVAALSDEDIVAIIGLELFGCERSIREGIVSTGYDGE